MLPIGREGELGLILDCVELGRSRPQSLLLLGDAGAGKTELLRFATEQARMRHTRVLPAQGCEAEAQQSFASLHQLLLPVLGDLDPLPEHLRDALRTAFGLAPATGPVEPLLFRIAVLTLLGQVARTGPVLLIVDDIQHCDRDSLEVLSFVTRRLTTEPVAVLLAARGEVPPPGVAPDVTVLSVGPLSDQAAAQLLDSLPGAPTGGARLDLLRQAEGNPLAIIELCQAVRTGGAPALSSDGRPRTSRIQQMFAAQLTGLPAATQRALLYAATASEQEELTTVMAALGAGPDLAVWAPAEDAGLVGVTDGRVAFRHPLIRTAALQREPARQRQQAHQDLAAVLGEHPSRQAWHLAGAAIGPDESVATALENTALLAQRRGGLFATAKAFELAARFSPSDDDRARRLAKALTAANDFGDPAWVRELYARFAAVNRDADLLRVATTATSWALSLSSFQREAFDLVLNVWERHPPRGSRVALTLAAIAAGIAHQSGLVAHRQVLPGMLEKIAGIEQTEQYEPDEAEPHHHYLVPDEVVASLKAVVLTLSDPAAHARGLLSTLTAAPRVSADHGLATLTYVNQIASLAYFADESDQCVDLFRQTFAPLQARGAMGPATGYFALQVDSLLSTGRWAEAAELIEEAHAFAVVRRMTYIEMDLDALRVTLRALRGDSEPGMVLTGSHWHSVSLDENRATHARMLRARGVTAMDLGDNEGAFRHFRSLFADDGAPLHYFLSNRCITLLAAAAQRIGQQEDAARVLAAVRSHEGARPTTRMKLLMHHAAALVDEEADPEHHFRLAVVNPVADQWPMERAHARLNYAIWLRRRRRPLEARTQLASVLEAATRLGARSLAEQAHGELRASGVASAPASADPLSELTAQQQQIVRLAANGLSNREIGAQLLLSPRTVGSHLYNVYPKLGISSRHQLRDMLESDGRDG